MRRVLDGDARALVVALTREGVSAARIADRVGCSERTVVRVRVREGVSRRTGSPVPADVWAAAHRLLEDGAPYRETARTFGVDLTTLMRRFRGMGVGVGQGGRIADMHRQLKELDGGAR